MNTTHTKQNNLNSYTHIYMYVRAVCVIACLVLVIFVLVPQMVSAATTNIWPDSNTISGNDNTGETLSEITADDSSVTTWTLSAVNPGDNTYSVDKSDIMQFDSFDTSAIPAGSTINGATLWVEWGGENGYNGTTKVRYLNNSSTLTDTTIQPDDDPGWTVSSYDLYGNDSAAVNTISKLTNMDIEFTSGDGAGASAIHFDYAYIAVEFTPPPITVSGTLYSDEGSTQITTGKTIKLAVGTSTPTVFSTTTDSGAGTWNISFTPAGVDAGTPISVWVDGDSGTRAFTLTKASSSVNGISGIDLYQNRVIVKHEAATSTGTSTTIADLAFYDSDDDSDIQFNASSTAGTLTIFKGQELHVWTGTRFNPGGSVTLNGNGAASPDGDLHVDDNAIFSQKGLITLAGDFAVDSGAVFGADPVTGLIFNATTTGKTLSGTLVGANVLGSTTFDGSGGGWTFSDNASTSNLTIVNGAVVAPPKLTISGSYSNSGTFTSGDDIFIDTHDTFTGLSWTKIGGDGINSSWADSVYESVASIERMGDKLYAGLGNTTNNDAEVWELDGSTWTQIGGDSLNSSWGSGPGSVSDLMASGTTLYALAGNNVWEYNGSTWTQIGGDSLNSSWVSTNRAVNDLISFGNKLLVAIGNSGASQSEVWEYNGSTWTQIGGDSLNSSWGTEVQAVTSFTSVDGSLYAGIGVAGGDAYVWEYNGSSWTKIGGDGINSSWATSSAYEGVYSVAALDGKVYAGLGYQSGYGEVWEYNGSTWTQIGGDSLNSSWSGNDTVEKLVVSDNKLYAGLGNDTGEAEIWEYSGSAWTQIAGDGVNSSWADSAYEGVRSLLLHNGTLYAGIGTGSGDGELWKVEKTAAQTLSGTLTGTSALGNVTFLNDVTNNVFSNNASTTDFTINSGATVVAPPTLTIGGDYTNNGIFDANGGSVYFSSTSAQSISGNLNAANTFNDVTFVGSGTKTLASNASTTDFTISAVATVVAPALLTIGGNYTNNGTFTHNDGTAYFRGRTATGTLSGTSAFNNVVIDPNADGSNWATSTSAADNAWTNVTYGKGLFVAVACGVSGTSCNSTAGNRVMTSPDGITWTSRTSASDGWWRSITYGNGLFVAVSDYGTGNRVMTSPDGITWTSRDTTGMDNTWWDVTYGNGLFVAVAGSGTGNRVMTSPDGITWTSRDTTGMDNTWKGVTYGNGLFVAVAGSGTGNRVMTSSDGITWATSTSAADNSWTNVTYGNGLFVAVSSNGGDNHVMTSPNGIAWTLRESAGGNNSYQYITYGNGFFVSTAGFDVAGTHVMTSSDGINWTGYTGAVDRYWYGVTYGNGLFISVSQSGTSDRVMISDVGILVFGANASTTNLTISGGTTTAPTGDLTVAGDYTNNGVFDANGGTVYMAGADAVISGNLTGTSAFNDVQFLEGVASTFGSGGGVVADPTSNDDRTFGITSDDTYIYTIGRCDGCGSLGGYAFYTTKNRKSDGSLVWAIASDPTSGDDRGYGVAVDGSYVYVTGFCTGCDGAVSGAFHTIKLQKSDGAEVWATTTDAGSGIDNALGIAVDDSNIYVTGGCTGCGPLGLEAYYTVAYQKSNGTEIWATTTDLTTGADMARSVVVDDTYVYVTGDCTSCNGASSLAFYTQKLQKSDGAAVWATTTDPSGSGDQAFGITEDTDYIYVTGSCDGCGDTGGISGYTIKLQKSDGAEVWATSTDPTVGSDTFRSVVDDNQNLYLGGFCTNCGGASSKTYYATKLQKSDGALIWATSTDPASDVDTAYAITSDTNHIYLGGYCTDCAGATSTASYLVKLRTLDGSIVDGAGDSVPTTFTFSSAASTTGTFTANVGSSTIVFPASATSTLTNIDFQGSAGSPVYLKSSTPGTQWGIITTGTQNVSYVDVADSNACDGNVINYDDTSTTTNTSCWTLLTTVTLSGVLYTDEGITAETTGGETIKISIATSTPSVTATTTSVGTGAWTADFESGSISAGDQIQIWVDGNASLRATLVTKFDTVGSVSGLDLYQNRVIVRHEATSGTSTTNADMALYDATDDTDIQFDVTGGDLTINAGQELHIWTGDTFAPGGEVTISGNASTTATDGTFHIPDNATYTPTATTTLAGSFRASTTATFTAGAYPLIFNATTTGKIIEGSATSTNTSFSSVTFDGSGGAWAFQNNASTTDLTITNGAVTAPPSLTIGGNFTNNDTFTHNSGTIYTDPATTTGASLTGDLTGNNALNDLTILGTTTIFANASTSDLTIKTGAAGKVQAHKVLDVSGDYTNNGTFAAGGVTYFSGSSAQTIAGNLAGAENKFSSVEFLGAGTKTFSNNASTTNFTIDSTSGEVTAPTELTILGDYQNDATFTHNSGNVILGINSTTTQVGSDLNISGFMPSLTLVALNSTDVAYIDTANDDLRTYRFNGSTWSQVGSGLGISGAGIPTLAALNSTDIAFIDGSNDDLRTYRFNGSTWSQVGSDLNIPGSPADNSTITALNSTDIAYYNGDNNDLRTYRFNGSTWSQVGSDLNIAGFMTSSALTALNSTDVAYYNSDDDDLRTYRFNGSTWSQIGSGISITGAADPTLTALNSTDVAFADMNNKDLRIYRFDGSAWSQVGSVLDITGVNFGVGVASLNGTDVAYIDGGNQDLRTYRLQYSGNQTNSGTMTGTSAFNNINIIGTTTFAANASTTDFIIASAGSTTAPTSFTISGDYTNNGIFTHNSGTVYIASTTAEQSFSGTMTGDSAFYDLNILNGGATTTFTSAASTTGTFSATTPNSIVVFPANSTSTLTNLVITGTSGNEIKLRSSTDGTQWGIVVTGTQSVAYADVKDSNACDGDTITYTEDSAVTNSSCWTQQSAIIISGTLYSDEGSTQITTGKTIHLIVGTSTPGVFATSTDSGAGTYQFTNLSSTDFSVDDLFAVYVDGDATTRAYTATKASSTQNNITGLDLYQNRMIIRHESTDASASTTNADINTYDSNDDADIQFEAVEEGWDVTTAIFDVTSPSVNGEDSSPKGLALNASGTKMYVLGDSTNSVYSYTLSTPWDVSTASYANASTSVATQDTAPYSIAFSATGTKMYILGWQGRDINPYTLGTPWDITTASYDGSSHSVITQEPSPQGIAFKPDGTKMYVAGDNDFVYPYTLSTPWNVTTALFDDVSFSVASEERDVRGLTFKSDGTKMYILGMSGDDVNQYTLSVPWDVTSAVFDRVIFSPKTEDTQPYDVAFKSDGMKMYILGYTGDDVNQYTLATSTNLTIQPEQELHVWDGDTYTPEGSIRINGNASTTATDGSLHIDSNSTLTTADQIVLTGNFNAESTATYTSSDSITFNASTTGKTIIGGIQGLNDVIFNGIGGAWSFSDNASTSDFNIATGTVTAPASLTIAGDFTNNGSFDSNSGTIYAEGGAGNVSTALVGGSPFSISAQDTSPTDITFNSDGDKMFIIGGQNDSIYSYSLSTVWDITTASYDNASTSISSQDIYPEDIAFSTDGATMYILGSEGDDVTPYILSTPWDITTASATSPFSISSQEVNSKGFTFKPDGTKMYMIGTASDAVNPYTLSTPWDITTAAFDTGDAFSVVAQDSEARDVTFSLDGTKMYMITSVGDKIYQYTLSTPWDVTSAVFDSINFYVGSEELTPEGLELRSDGNAMFVVGSSGDEINQYTVGHSFSGTMTGSDTFNDVVFTNDASKVFATNASTTNFTINASSSVHAPSGSLTIDGDYTNNGTFTHDSGTLYLEGRTASGTMVGTSAFNDVIVDPNGDAINWATSSSAADSAWRGVIYAEGLFVAVGSTGTGNRVMTSPDGMTWTLRTSAADNTWSDVTYGNGRFVAVSSDGGSSHVMTSPDGIAWTSRTSASDLYWRSVTYGNGLFVSTAGSGTGNRVMTSPDGITWISRTSAADLDWRSVTYGNNIFVAVADEGTDNRVMTSQDGITWTSRTSAADNSWKSVTYGDGMFVAVASTGHVMTSPDGIAWTSRTSAAVKAWNSVVYGNGMFVAVSNGGTNGVMTSPDGITWTSRTTADSYWFSIAYGKGIFIVTPLNGFGAEVMISATGTLAFNNNASTTDLTLMPGTTTAPTSLTVAGDYTNSGTFDANGGEVVFDTSVEAYDVAGAAYKKSVSVSAEEDYPRSVNFSTDGTQMYVLGESNRKVNPYTLSVPWDVTTASATTPFSVSAQDNTPIGLTFDTDGSKMYMLGYSGKDINPYTLSTPWDVTSATFDGTPFSVSAEETSPYGLTFNNSGTIMYLIGWDVDDVNPYTLSIPWDVTTASATTPFSVSGQDSNPTDIAFSTDGTKMYIVGSYGDDVNLYTLSVPWDVTSAAFDGSPFSISAQETIPYGLTFKPDGTKMYISGLTGSTIYQYTLGSELSGALTGTSAFNDVSFQNDGIKIFNDDASSAGTFTINTSGAQVIFTTTGTSTFNNINWTGGTSSTTVTKLFSTASGTQWAMDVSGTQAVTYMDAQDSNACDGDGISAGDGTNVDSGNNDCWNFEALMTSASNQIFGVGLATTSISEITITEQSPATITAANDIRIVIASTTVDMKWDTDDTTAVFGGTASTSVSNPVSYEGNGSILVIPVGTNFVAEETLTISGLSFAQFGSSNIATTALSIRTGGSGDATDEAVDLKTVAISGSLTLAASDGGQATNAFIVTDNATTSLYTFKMTPSGEDVAIPSLSFALTGVRKFTTGNISSIGLYRDYNGNGTVDGVDTAVGGAGSISISGTTGSIDFASSFNSTTSENYILQASLTGIKPSYLMTLSLDSVTGTGSTTSGSITSTGNVGAFQHIRTGGAGGDNAPIGGAAPESIGTSIGGSNDGGDVIGNAPGFFAPTSNGSPQNQWGTPANAYASDGTYATSSNASDAQSYADFGFNLQAGTVSVVGIEVKLEASGTTASGTIEVALSWDGGTSVTTAKATPVLTGTDAIYVLGSPSDNWGHTWTKDELSNANFRVRVIAQPDGNTVQIDAIQVNPEVVSTGGGGGGGGEVSIPSEHFFANVSTAPEFLEYMFEKLKGWFGW